MLMPSRCMPVSRLARASAPNPCATQARAAEEKKLGVREQLALIRAEFEELLAENAARPEAERLPRSEFEMDPGAREQAASSCRLVRGGPARCGRFRAPL